MKIYHAILKLWEGFCLEKTKSVFWWWKIDIIRQKVKKTKHALCDDFYVYFYMYETWNVKPEPGVTYLWKRLFPDSAGFKF